MEILEEELANTDDPEERKSIRRAIREIVREVEAYDRWREEGDEYGW
jgi:hypothetical protein